MYLFQQLSNIKFIVQAMEKLTAGLEETQLFTSFLRQHHLPATLRTRPGFFMLFPPVQALWPKTGTLKRVLPWQPKFSFSEESSHFVICLWLQCSDWLLLPSETSWVESLFGSLAWEVFNLNIFSFWKHFSLEIPPAWLKQSITFSTYVSKKGKDLNLGLKHKGPFRAQAAGSGCQAQAKEC